LSYARRSAAHITIRPRCFARRRANKWSRLALPQPRQGGGHVPRLPPGRLGHFRQASQFIVRHDPIGLLIRQGLGGVCLSALLGAVCDHFAEAGGARRPLAPPVTGHPPLYRGRVIDSFVGRCVTALVLPPGSQRRRGEAACRLASASGRMGGIHVLPTHVLARHSWSEAPV